MSSHAGPPDPVRRWLLRHLGPEPASAEALRAMRALDWYSARE